MAMIQCPECGKEVSDKAKSCPTCGNPINESANIEVAPAEVKSKAAKKPIYKRFWFIALAVIVLLIIIISISGGSKDSLKVTIDGNSMTLGELKDEYEANGRATQEKYELKEVSFTDTIKEINGRTIYNGHEMPGGYIETKNGIIVEATGNSVDDLSVGDKINVHGYIYKVDDYKPITIYKNGGGLNVTITKAD